MDRNVTVVDDFLDPIDFRKVVDYTKYPATWQVQCSNPHLEDSSQEFLSAKVKDNDEFFNKYLFNKVKKHLEGEYKLERIYFNGQWTGREGYMHDDNCDITALLYVSDYEYGWGGFTEIMSSVERPVILHPLPNRLVIFPGRIKHKGYSFAYQRCPMRISLAFKLNTK